MVLTVITGSFYGAQYLSTSYRDTWLYTVPESDKLHRDYILLLLRVRDSLFSFDEAVRVQFYLTPLQNDWTIHE